MVFSSIIFLFLFLPISLFCYFISPRNLRNFTLLVLSLFFYAWGEGFFVVVMLASIGFNYILGRFIDHYRGRESIAQMFLFMAIFINLGLLGVFKYTNFFVDNLNGVLVGLNAVPIAMDPVHLPIGISFFTFQAMSYVIDVYRRTSPVQKNIFDIGLYIALFPQLIAGPIVRYHDIANQIMQRVVTRDGFATGIRRFIIGLGKKVLIANNVAIVADEIFALPPAQLSTELAWLGIICYSLQIFFDFSGYSDMAIGLGQMFGFRFLENFNYPYIATSIRDFWRRWHISLSNWFRDYLYIPLGGNRKGTGRTYINLYIVFFLTGLWHGASWNFVIWGLIHGTFMVIERLGFGKVLNNLWRPLQHIYTLLVVIVAWVFFRAETLPHALEYIGKMFSLSEGFPVHNFWLFVDNEVLAALILGIILSTPVFQYVQHWVAHLPDAQRERVMVWEARLMPASSFMIMSFMLVLSVSYMATGSHNPFIYFRF